jgi:hypothetical protein
MQYFRLILSISLLLIYGCKKDGPQNHKPDADFIATDKIDHFELTDKSIDEDADVLTYKWTSSSNLITISGGTSSHASFQLPDPLVSGKVQVKLLVNDKLSSDSITKEIDLPGTSIQRSYGLGVNLISETSNNTDYDWYIDQGSTGTYSSINCGPTSVTMAIKWVDKSFTGTPVDARNTFRPEGGWWYTNDIVNYLNKYSVHNKTIGFGDGLAVKNQIDLGNIAILCLDMYYISNGEKSTWHVDKFYNAISVGWGHFIVVKGYKVVDNEIFYEMYDPYSLGIKYGDGSMKGKDRYYRNVDLRNAVTEWWPYAIVVSRNSLKNLKGLDNSKIVNKPGL